MLPKKTKTKAPDHKVLSSESMLNRHLTEIVQLAVARELRYWRAHLHNLFDGDAGTETMFDTRILELDPNNQTIEKPKTTRLTLSDKKPSKRQRNMSSMPEELQVFRRDLVAEQGDASMIVGWGPNNTYGVKTKHAAMFFPVAGDSLYDVEEIFNIMLTVNGGAEISRICGMSYGAKEHIHYKGWAECRACNARLGSSDEVYKDVTVPAEANHYRKVHGLPLNLFSTKVGTYRVFYVAERIQRNK